jgi:hypothetical protein
MGEVVGKGKIVTNGLVLSLDAADRNSYPGTGTTWTDLSGRGFNGTSTNNPTFDSANGGSIVFTRTSSQYVALTPSFSGPPITFLGFIRRNGAQYSENAGIFFDRVGSNTASGIHMQSSGQVQYHWNDAANTYGWTSGLSSPDQQWCMVALVVTSTSATLYTNLTSATNNVTHNNRTFTSFRIAQDDVPGRFFNGNVANLLVYTRALSSTEIAQNYNALKQRFGL